MATHPGAGLLNARDERSWDPPVGQEEIHGRGPARDAAGRLVLNTGPPIVRRDRRARRAEEPVRDRRSTRSALRGPGASPAIALRQRPSARLAHARMAVEWAR